MSFSSGAVASTQAPQATCAVAFSGSSTLKDFTGTLPPVTTQLESAAAPGHWNVDLLVPIAAVDTGSSSRDARLRELFRTSEIRVSLEDLDPAAVRSEHRLRGTLTLAGRTREFVATLANWKEDEHGASFDASGTISLADFGLPAPTVLGVIRVADTIEVSAHVEVDAIRQAAARAG